MKMHENKMRNNAKKVNFNNNYKKYNNHHQNNHHNKGFDNIDSNSDISKIDSRCRHNNNTLKQLVDKYNALAREALANGDRVVSESFFQYVDHYSRILAERRREFQVTENTGKDAHSLEQKNELEKAIIDSINNKSADLSENNNLHNKPVLKNEQHVQVKKNTPFKKEIDQNADKKDLEQLQEQKTKVVQKKSKISLNKIEQDDKIDLKVTFDNGCENESGQVQSSRDKSNTSSSKPSKTKTKSADNADSSAQSSTGGARKSNKKTVVIE